MTKRCERPRDMSHPYFRDNKPRNTFWEPHDMRKRNMFEARSHTQPLSMIGQENVRFCVGRLDK